MDYLDLVPGATIKLPVLEVDHLHGTPKDLSDQKGNPVAAGARPDRPDRGPSFIFVGASRAGSSWFFEALREHPQIFVPPNKGTLYFSRFHELGVDWYEGFFPVKPTGRIIGEVCEHYLSSAEALARIRDYRPDVRLICCIRNPYERALSAWRFFIRNGVGQPSLSAEGAQRPDIFSNGYYATQLATMRELFPAEQMHVIAYDDLVMSAATVTRRLYEFVGADPNYVPSTLNRRVNANARPRSRVLAHVVHNLHMRSWGSSRWLSNAVGLIKRLQPVRRLVTSLLYKEDAPSSGWSAYLGEFPDSVIARYEAEISALEKMLQRSFAHWRAPIGGVRPAGGEAALVATARRAEAARTLEATGARESRRARTPG